MPRSTLRRAVRASALCLTATTAAAAPAAAQTHAVRVSGRQLNIRAGSRASVAGSIPGAPLTASLQIRRGGRWVTLDRDRTSAVGRYVLRARVRRPMSVPARVRLSSGATRPLGRLNVYRYALASWYGPGFDGRRTGCGGTFSSSRLGVAHKTLPCGSRVTLRHGHRVVRVPVIDRGPYSGGREFDLTVATARRLRFHGHGSILVAR